MTENSTSYEFCFGVAVEPYFLFARFHVKTFTFIHYKIIIIYTECSARAYVDYIVVHAV